MSAFSSATQQHLTWRYQKAQLLLLVAIVALAGVAVYLAYATREQVWSSAHRSLRSLAIALETSSTELLDQSAASLTVLHADLPEYIPGAAALDELRRVMRLDPVSEYLGVIPPSRHTMVAVDHGGDPISEVVVRDLLSQLPRSQKPGFDVAPPVHIGPGREAYVPLILTPETGQIPTVTFALVPAKRLLGSPEELSLVPHSRVLFVAEDGRRLFLYGGGQFDSQFTGRSSAEVMQQARSRPIGSIEFVPPYNGVRAVLGWARSSHFPFYVGAFVNSSALRAVWLERAAMPIGILLLALIAVVVFAAQLNRALQSQRVYAEKQEYLAAHDTLTGLMNRAAFVDAVGTQLAARPEATLAVFLLDLNRFKDINDSLGHAAGDHVLQELSRRLKDRLDAQTLSARLGEDELAFARAFENASVGQSALLATIQSTVGDPIRLLGVTLEISATIGIALYPRDANNASELLRCADIARSTAKTELRPFATYAESTDRSAPERLALLGDLARALRDGQIRLVYQPKVRLSDRRVCGFEALARWHHPKLGPVPPSSFVAIAETTELIHPFTQYVIEHALRQSARWRSMGVQLPISVNVSANNLLDAAFVERLAELLKRHDVPGELLELEITESALLRHPETILRRLNEIRLLGVPLAIDDFGTGYASLAYLKRLPVQSLKIDKAFILNLLSDPADQRIVRSAIQLAHGFGLRVVAEGVESAAVAERLLLEGSDYGQGYFLGTPQEAAEIERTVLPAQPASPAPDLA